jgi:O-antigen ligase
MNNSRSLKDLSVSSVEKIGGNFSLVLLITAFILMSYCLDFFLPGYRIAPYIYITLMRVALIIGLLILIFQVGINKLSISINNHDIILVFLYISLCISMLWSIDKIITIKSVYWIFYLVFFYFYLIVGLAPGNRIISLNYYFLFAPFIYFGVSYYIYLIFGSLRPSMLDLGQSDIFVGSFSNYVASSVEVSLPFLYNLIITGKKRVKMVAIISLTFTFLVLLLSQSRGALLASLLITIIFIFLYPKRGGMKLLLLAFIIIFIGLIIFSKLIFRDVATDYAGRFDRKIEQESRLGQFMVGLKMVEERPILGWGYGVTAENYQRGKGRIGQKVQDMGGEFHNFFLEIWAGAGLFSLIIFLYMVIHLLNKIRKIMYTKEDIPLERRGFVLAVYVGLIGVILHGLVRPLLDNPNLYVLLAMGSIFVSQQARSNESIKS